MALGVLGIVAADLLLRRFQRTTLLDQVRGLFGRGVLSMLWRMPGSAMFTVLFSILISPPLALLPLSFGLLASGVAAAIAG